MNGNTSFYLFPILFKRYKGYLFWIFLREVEKKLKFGKYPLLRKVKYVLKKRIGSFFHELWRR